MGFEACAQNSLESLWLQPLGGHNGNFTPPPQCLSWRGGTLIWAHSWPRDARFSQLLRHYFDPSPISDDTELPTAAPQSQKLQFSAFPPRVSNKLILLRWVCICIYMLTELYIPPLSKSLLSWKPTWSVWSIGTFSTIGIWKFRSQKDSYGGKLTFHEVENWKFQFSSITRFFGSWIFKSLL